jgi:EmrB/QacA subfamily drug resistance transporter
LAGNLKERDGLRLGLLSCAQFVLVVDATIVLVSLPTISRELHFSQSNLQWVITFYALTFGGFLMVGGRAGDLLGRRRVFVTGLFLFAAMSALCALAQSPGMLIAGRAGQGLGAAMASPAALSLLTSTFPEGPKRNTALGVFTAVGASGATMGNVLGGVITSTIGWRWIFLVNVPICALVITCSFFILPASRDRTRQPLDAIGAITVTAGLGLFIYALAEIEQHGILSPSAIIPMCLAVVFIVGFVLREARFSAPLIPGSMLHRPLIVGNILLVLAFMTGPCVYYFTSLFFQDVQSHSPLWTGFAFAPWAATIACCSILASRSNARFGGRPIATVGFAAIAVGAVLIVAAMTETSTYLAILPGFLIIGAGNGFAGVTNTIAAMAGVDRHHQGAAAGLTNSSQRLGQAIGLSVLATIATGHINSLVASGSSELSAQLAGYRLGVLMAGGIALVGAVAAGIFIRSRRPDPQSASDEIEVAPSDAAVDLAPSGASDPGPAEALPG